MFGKFGYVALVATIILLSIKMLVIPTMPGWIVLAAFMIPFFGWAFCFVLALLWIAFILSLRIGIDLLTIIFK